ncbi:hypothetical protein Dsin_012027 [Dipteronia sinensis]|uniref:Reverse transcriptase n=1 Tax=Dipteronia sinensis TaxID=43782 RepID=A0AAE0AHB5_9ROSI|nr:hypothetical protein Dsin_012027 [Dipteronia sinensis]
MMDEVSNRVQPKLTDSMKIMDRKFIGDEVKRVIFDMMPLKALGADGIPTLFYQRFWEIVGPYETEACLKCLNDGAYIKEMKGTVITLIPKIKDVVQMYDFRPISLCNVLYKIVTETLANRFRMFLGEVISN